MKNGRNVLLTSVHVALKDSSRSLMNAEPSDISFNGKNLQDMHSIGLLVLSGLIKFLPCPTSLTVGLITGHFVSAAAPMTPLLTADVFISSFR